MLSFLGYPLEHVPVLAAQVLCYACSPKAGWQQTATYLTLIDCLFHRTNFSDLRKLSISRAAIHEQNHLDDHQPRALTNRLRVS